MVRSVVAALLLVGGLAPDKKIEVLKMNQANYNENVIIKKMYSESGIIGPKWPLVLQVGEFPIGVSLANRPEWLKGMRESANGSAILLWVYGENQYQKRFYLSKDDGTSFIEDKTYFKDRFRKYLDENDLPGLPPGKIAITGLLVNGYGESIKISKATKSIVVDYLQRTDDHGAMEKALEMPHLVYNEPYGNFQEDQAILLDFYVFNADIGRDAYTVQLFIDGAFEETLYEWAPYKVRNLAPGVHEVQIKLMSPGKKLVSEPFGEQKNLIRVGS